MRTILGKRFTTFLLVVMILTGVMPTTVFAEDTEIGMHLSTAEATDNSAKMLTFSQATTIYSKLLTANATLINISRIPTAV